jgi:hypothetical protein
MKISEFPNIILIILESTMLVEDLPFRLTSFPECLLRVPPFG